MKKLKNMSDVCPNPSDAVRAMVKGLRTARDAKDFRIDMGSFGHVERKHEEKICAGCAATCAILESLNLWTQKMKYGETRNFWRSKKRSQEDKVGIEKIAGVAMNDLLKFESVINDLREGDAESICDYYPEADIPIETSRFLPPLSNQQDESKLEEYEAFADALKTAGL